MHPLIEEICRIQPTGWYRFGKPLEDEEHICMIWLTPEQCAECQRLVDAGEIAWRDFPEICGARPKIAVIGMPWKEPFARLAEPIDWLDVKGWVEISRRAAARVGVTDPVDMHEAVAEAWRHIPAGFYERVVICEKDSIWVGHALPETPDYIPGWQRGNPGRMDGRPVGAKREVPGNMDWARCSRVMMYWQVSITKDGKLKIEPTFPSLPYSVHDQTIEALGLEPRYASIDGLKLLRINGARSLVTDEDLREQ